MKLQIRGHHLFSIRQVRKTTLEEYLDPMNVIIYGEESLTEFFNLYNRLPPYTIIEIIKDWDDICNACHLKPICENYSFEEMKVWVEERVGNDPPYAEESYDMDKRDQDCLDLLGLKVGDILTLDELCSIVVKK